MIREASKPLTGDLLDDRSRLTLHQLCEACRVSTETVVELVEYGIVDPEGQEPERWQFRAVSVRRVHSADRLRRDLGVNAAGAALALDLLDEIEQLKARLRRLGA